MLVWNRLEKLTNDCTGRFRNVEDGHLKVWFDEIGVVRIEREKWVNRNHNVEIGGIFRGCVGYSLSHKFACMTNLPLFVCIACSKRGIDLA